MSSQPKPTSPGSGSKYLPVIFGAAIFLVVVAFVFSPTSAGNSSATLGSSGTSSIYDTGSIPKDILNRCVSICKDVLSAGASLDDGMCFVEDLNGYGCGVADPKGNSPCESSGTLPQVLLKPDCTVIGG